MQTLAQLPGWQQALIAMAVLISILVVWGLVWSWRLLRRQRSNQMRYEQGLQQLMGVLHQQERALMQQQAQLRDQLSERILKGALAQQRTLHGMQQALQERSDRLYRGLERRFGELQQHLGESLAEGREVQQQRLSELREGLAQALTGHRQAFDERQLEAMSAQQEALQSGMGELRKQLHEVLTQHADSLGRRFEGLTEATDRRLGEIAGQVERRLDQGFEKTRETFNQVLIHLTRIDEAQKRITELSSSVVSLQEVLSDKRSRGAFGEVQLNALVRNVMPESGFALQQTLGNGRRADCVLFLPDPTGNVVIDAKFPLESYQRMLDEQLADTVRARAQRQFRQDIKRHIDDIAGKYIIPGETSDGAVMFIPAEAVFAEIHAHFPDLVEEAFRRRVWLVSPTTMMAILTTARAVLKDAATREQVHIIQQHLRALSKDFGRFQGRMDNLARHISQAHQDVSEVNISARKISNRFERIEKVDLQEKQGPELPVFRQPGLSDERQE